MKRLTTLALAALLTTGAWAATPAVSSVAYTALSGTLITFDSLPLGDPDGSLLDGLVSAGGVQFGERFAGQELGIGKAPRPGELAQDWFDNLNFGAPSAGLSLLAGATGQNLGVYDYGDADGQALAGIGPKPGGFAENFGFGAISARFASGQSGFGFQLREADAGTAVLSLYRADGSLIQTLNLDALDNGYFAFARSGGAADIAGFSLTHTDRYYGIAIDNLLVGSVTAVPEPASALLLGGGVLGLMFWRRRQR